MLQQLSLPVDLAYDNDAILALFPNASAVNISANLVTIPVEITTAVQATAVLSTGMGASVTVPVGNDTQVCGGVGTCSCHTVLLVDYVSRL